MQKGGSALPARAILSTGGGVIAVRPGGPQNFVINAAEAQYMSQMTDDGGALTELGRALELVDTVFTALFTAELAMNLASNWFWDFVSDGW